MFKFNGGFACGFVGSAGNTWMNGGSFGDGFGAGIQAGFVGGYSGGIINGISGGFRAVKNGRDFWSGDISYSNYFRAKGEAIQKSINELKFYNNQDFGLDYYLKLMIWKLNN